RNRGNIKFSQWEVERWETLKAAQWQEALAEVRQAWMRMKESMNAFQESKTVFDHRYDQVFEGVQKSLLNRHIPLMEFVDFFESYQEAQVHMVQFRLDVLLAAETLNYAVFELIY